MDPSWMYTNATTPYRVHVGTWTNWSHGSVFGATLTLTRRDGNLLIAFMAFFVSVVGARLWRILCLGLHRAFSTPNRRDALHHQRQAILRNSANAESGVWAFGQLLWAWHRTARRPLLRTLPWVLGSAFCVAALTAASGFSSRVSTGIGNEVLLDGSNCGLVLGAAETADTQPDASAVQQAHTATIVASSANYGEQCYTSNSSGIFDCTTFVVDKLPITVDNNAPCPFPGNICRSQSSNLRLDTGYLDSNDHLGVNSAPDERILFRQVYHCAPLVTHGYSKDWNGANETYTQYYYGPALVGSMGNETTLNYTFEVENLYAQYNRHKDDHLRNHGISFRVAYQATLQYNGNVSIPDSEFIAGPELQRPDGDIYIIFLIGNGVSFLTPTNDTWYRGNVSVDGLKIYSSVETDPTLVYLPEEAASPMGCVEQYQYCNAALPEGEQCGPLAGYLDAIAGAGPKFNLTRAEALSNHTATNKLGSRFLWFTNTLIRAAAMPKDILSTLQGQALLSKQTLYDGFQAGLATEQWKLDATNWWSIWLASLQGSFIIGASGPGKGYESFLYPPGDSFQRDILFGLYFVFASGGLVIIASFMLEPIYKCLQRRRNYKAYQLLEWKTHGTLHLQRLGYQGLGDRGGTWSHLEKDVPITMPGELLGSLASIGTLTEGGEVSAKESASPQSHTESGQAEDSRTLAGSQDGHNVPPSPELPTPPESFPELTNTQTVGGVGVGRMSLMLGLRTCVEATTIAVLVVGP
ncbi:hypothetical protein GQ53DRAFT_833851 [Thozetella sp. PMI_491]|nr:hypothetical protein GQ53DRAFT_833851 [Thozetella sp. PMI_491]